MLNYSCTPAFSNSNRRAVTVLVVSLLVLMGVTVPVWGAIHLTDEANGVAEQLFAAAISELEDMNSDGRGEFLVGAPGDNVNGQNTGAVFYYRSRSGNSHGLQQVWRGTAQERFGYAVARIGDINSDGTPDFAVGAPTSNAAGLSSGRVYLFWGGSSISTTADMVIDGTVAGDQFGFSLSAAGDIDGDGEDDLIVGAPYANEPGMESGAAYVIFGGNGGPSDDLADALVLGGENGGDHFGWSVTDVGNFFSAANDCVAVGAPDNLSAGAVYVFEGDATPDAVFDHKIVNGAAAAPNSKYGQAVRGIGRWDSDTLDDLAIGAPECNESAANAGRVEIVFGDSSPSGSGDRYVNGETATDLLGFALARTGDVLGNSRHDLLIGAPGFDGDASDGGRAYLYAGGSNSTNDAGTLMVLAVDPLNPGTAADDQFGYAVSSAGLFDDDAQLDYAVGAPGGNIGNTAAAGFCWIQDSSGGVVANVLSFWDAVWNSQSQVELGFAVTLPAQEISALSLSRRTLASDGTLLSENILWQGAVTLNGPALLPGGLNFSGDDFTFTDANPPVGNIAYTLSVTTTDDQTITLGSLAGPGQTPTSAVTLAMDPAWPNPFNPQVSVRFRAPEGQPTICRVSDLRGRLVATLYQGPAQSQWQTVTWDGQTADGLQAASGVYFISLEAGAERQVQRVVLAK